MTRTRLVWFIVALVVAVANGAALGQPLPKPMDGPLPAGALASLPATFSPAMFSPDGKYFLAGSATEHHEYCLWDVATRKLVRTFTAPKKASTLVFGAFYSFNAAAFSADGKVLATGSDALRIWDVDTGKEIRAWHHSIDGVGAVALSPDGKTLMSMPGRRDRAVRVWDTQTGKQRHEFPTQKNTIACLSPSGKQVAIVGERLEVIVWDAESGERAYRFPLARYSNATRVSFHPDGKSIIVVNMVDVDRGGIRRYEAATGKDLGVVVEQADIRGIGFTNDFSVVATMTYADPIVRFWDVATGKVKGKVTAGDNQLGAIALSPDGKVLATQIQVPGTPFLLWKAPD